MSVRPRAALLLIGALLLLVFSLADTFAQSVSPSSGSPSLAVSPSVAGLDVARDVHLQNFPATTVLTVVLIDPHGGEVVLHPGTDAQGDGQLHLTPPDSGWMVGVYRVAAALPGGRAVSATFVAGDGKPHLVEEQYESWQTACPLCAFHIVGFGLPPSQDMDLNLALAGLIGSRTYHLHTSADGTLTLFIWPEQFSLGFFPVGTYRAELPSQGITSYFIVWEHPVAPTIQVLAPAAGGDTPVRFTQYPTGRYIWGIFARFDGTVEGETLVGPAALLHGEVDASVDFGNLPGGTYLMATPYDYGETQFTALDPTATPTATATPTPTPTATATPTATPAHVAPAKHSCRKGATRKAGRCVCKRGYTRIHGRCQKKRA